MFAHKIICSVCNIIVTKENVHLLFRERIYHAIQNFNKSFGNEEYLAILVIYMTLNIVLVKSPL